jgi:hypothetical protein
VRRQPVPHMHRDARCLTGRHWLERKAARPSASPWLAHEPCGAPPPVRELLPCHLITHHSVEDRQQPTQAGAERRASAPHAAWATARPTIPGVPDSHDGVLALEFAMTRHRGSPARGSPALVRARIRSAADATCLGVFRMGQAPFHPVTCHRARPFFSHGFLNRVPVHLVRPRFVDSSPTSVPSSCIVATTGPPSDLAPPWEKPAPSSGRSPFSQSSRSL